MQPSLGVALLPQLLPDDWAQAEPSRGAIAVVIDTLRFTSTACVALRAGATSITVLSQIESARQLARSGQPPLLLCGERHCVKIPGFDLGNSPFEYTDETVHGRQLVFSTTNGTVAVEAAEPAQQVALGSLLNRAAVVQWILAQPPAPIWIICAGTDGQIAHEDVLAAGAIAELLCQAGCSVLNDSAQLALDAWRQVAQPHSLLERLRSARGGRNLIESGFADDVDFASRLDSLPCVPVRAEKNPAVFVKA